jgi:peptidoglycan/LPS O-acetylase OafA/YrhL
MLQIDRAYIVVALFLAIAGMLLGLYMGIAADNQLLTVHVALLLPGFVTLGIYGMLYRLWPGMQKSPMAAVQFWLAMVGITGLVAGAYFFATSGSVPLAAIGSVVTILAAVLMVWLFLTGSRETA